MHMRTVTLAEASRSFDALLDAVESGESVVITRGGKRVALIRPACFGNGAAVRALLAAEVDEDFAADVAVARAAVKLEEQAERTDPLPDWEAAATS